MTASRVTAWHLTGIQVAALVLGLTSLGLTGGCKKPEAEMRAEDRTLLEPVVLEDERVAKAMSDADHLQRKGDIIGALDAVDSRARPAIEAGLRLNQSLAPRTEWGKAQQQALGRLLDDRKRELEPYRDAVLSNDEQKLVGALEAQVRLDRRALEIVGALHPQAR